MQSEEELRLQRLADALGDGKHVSLGCREIDEQDEGSRINVSILENMDFDQSSFDVDILGGVSRKAPKLSGYANEEYSHFCNIFCRSIEDAYYYTRFATAKLSMHILNDNGLGFDLSTKDNKKMFSYRPTPWLLKSIKDYNKNCSHYKDEVIKYYANRTDELELLRYYDNKERISNEVLSIYKSQYEELLRERKRCIKAKNKLCRKSHNLSSSSRSKQSRRSRRKSDLGELSSRIEVLGNKIQEAENNITQHEEELHRIIHKKIAALLLKKIYKAEYYCCGIFLDWHEKVKESLETINNSLEHIVDSFEKNFKTKNLTRKQIENCLDEYNRQLMLQNSAQAVVERPSFLECVMKDKKNVENPERAVRTILLCHSMSEPMACLGSKHFQSSSDSLSDLSYKLRSFLNDQSGLVPVPSVVLEWENSNSDDSDIIMSIPRTSIEDQVENIHIPYNCKRGLSSFLPKQFNSKLKSITHSRIPRSAGSNQTSHELGLYTPSVVTLLESKIHKHNEEVANASKSVDCYMKSESDCRSVIQKRSKREVEHVGKSPSTSSTSQNAANATFSSSPNDLSMLRENSDQLLECIGAQQQHKEEGEGSLSFGNGDVSDDEPNFESVEELNMNLYKLTMLLLKEVRELRKKQEETNAQLSLLGRMSNSEVRIDGKGKLKKRGRKPSKKLHNRGDSESDSEEHNLQSLLSFATPSVHLTPSTRIAADHITPSGGEELQRNSFPIIRDTSPDNSYYFGGGGFPTKEYQSYMPKSPADALPQTNGYNDLTSKLNSRKRKRRD